MENLKEESFLSAIKTKNEMIEIDNLVNYVAVQEGSSIVRFFLKDKSINLVNINENTIRSKSVNGTITERKINDNYSEKWLNFAKRKKQELLGEKCY